jgi:aspartate-semialdehyde dehydrogenase
MTIPLRETFAIYPSSSIKVIDIMNIAIVGATGNVGRKILEVLEQKKLPVDQLYLVASAKSVGQKITFNGKKHEVINLEKYDFSNAEITFFAAGGKISEQYAEKAAKNTIIIDNSSFFRMDSEVPLIVPQVNPEAINDLKKNIIANPNCSTAQLVIVLKPLHDELDIKRVVISTYQSVSGGGKAPMDELIEQTKLSLNNQKIESKNFTKQIAFNAIPHIDVFADDGYTKEELKMANETKKILDQKIELTATCVRIPVLVSHSEAVNIEFEKSFTLEKVKALLNSADGCEVYDKREDGGYVTPLEAEGKNSTYISRIREDKTKKNTINLWIVSDNLLRGAALNAVEIAELLVKKSNG